MKNFNSYKFINRFTQLPRVSFSHSKAMNMKIKDLDIVFKLLNFYKESFEINPNLSQLSEKSGTTTKTFQRIFSKLKKESYLKIKQNKDTNWYFSTNTYNLDWYFEKLIALQGQNKQLTLDFNCDSNSFWWKSKSLHCLWFIAVPRALDFYQSELDISASENVFIKYLFWYINQYHSAEISLNIMAKTTCFSRKTLQNIVKSLSEKWIIKVSKKIVSGTWRMQVNRYHLRPLLEKLNNLEKLKVENKLRARWTWKDYKREHRSIKKSNNVTEKIQEKTYNNSNTRRIFIQNELLRLKTIINITDTKIYNQIQWYEAELKILNGFSNGENNLSAILENKFKHLQKNRTTDTKVNVSYISKNDLIKAQNICKELRWNWKKSANFYIKAVTKFPNSIDRYVASAKELAKWPKENYFMTCVSKEFKKLNTVLN